MVGWSNLWLPMVLCYVAAAVAFYVAGRGKRPFVEPKLLEHLGEDGAALLRLRSLLEATLVLLAVFVPIHSGWSFTFGLIGVLVGGLVLVAGAYSRGGDESVLLRSGAYAYSRNPILTGRCLMLLGLLAMGVADAPAYMLFALAAFVSILAMIRWIEAEEAFLEREGGEEYLEYRKWVPRYFLFF